MFTVYAIRSLSTGRIYIGQTTNLEGRLRDHNAGRVQSTRRDKPWVLHALHRVSNRKEAMFVEWRIKRSRGTRLKWLAKNRVEDDRV